LSVLGACVPHERPTASLETGSEHGIYRFESGSFDDGYPLRIRCIAKCPRPADILEPVGDHPLGLFSRDQDDLVFYLTSSGSGYQVRVWQLTGSGVRRIGTFASRTRPEFASDAGGHAIIQTYEGGSGVEPWQPVRWTYRESAFVKTSTPAASTTRPSISSVSAQTSASARSGERPGPS
jgi:hypothetical protein